jgi:preprotein translocase subunit SecE
MRKINWLKIKQNIKHYTPLIAFVSFLLLFTSSIYCIGLLLASIEISNILFFIIVIIPTIILFIYCWKADYSKI